MDSLHVAATADGHWVIDHAKPIAGPFASNATAWHWIDKHTEEGLEDQDRFNRIGRAFDGQPIEGLG